MARIFNEQFEATGYDETWSLGETVDAGCTLDEDSPVQNALSPPDWGKLCLAADVVGATGNDAWVEGDLVNVSDEPDTWLQVEFVCITNGLDVDGNIARILRVTDSAGKIMYRIVFTNNGGTFKIKLMVRLNGVDDTTYYSAGISVNIMYRVEVMWKISAHQFEWRINGITQDKATLIDGHAIGLDVLRVGLFTVSATKNMLVFFDNLAIDDKKWVSEGELRRRGCNNRFLRLNRFRF